MSGHSEPGLVQARPLLEWLDDAFAAWDWQPGPRTLGPDVPSRIVTPTGLRRWLLATTTDYPTRDRVWAQIVTRSRSDVDARAYRFLALGLAVAGLRNYRRRIHLRTAADLPDVHADIVTGFLTRLATIDIPAQNLAGRLIDSGIGYAARRYHTQHTRPIPVDVNGAAPPAGEGVRPVGSTTRGSGAIGRPRGGDLPAVDATPGVALLHELAATAHRCGIPIAAGDLALIAATRLDGLPLITAAADLGIPAKVAYKRRRRAEHRLATVLQPKAPSPGL